MSGQRARSSISGQWIPKAVAEADPEHTELEAIDDFRLLHCPECDTRLGSDVPGWIEHNDDGSHTFYPEGSDS